MLPTRQLPAGPRDREVGRAALRALAYLVLLRVEIARFTPTPACANAGLVSVALILTSRWTGVTCYAALCSPDVPPVRPFGTCTSDGLACFTPAILADDDMTRRCAAAMTALRA